MSEHAIVQIVANVCATVFGVAFLVFIYKIGKK